jgi:hypothetical protein
MESRPRILVASSPRHMIAAGARADATLAIIAKPEPLMLPARVQDATMAAIDALAAALGFASAREVIPSPWRAPGPPSGTKAASKFMFVALFQGLIRGAGQGTSAMTYGLNHCAGSVSAIVWLTMRASILASSTFIRSKRFGGCTPSLCCSSMADVMTHLPSCNPKVSSRMSGP